MQATQLTPTQVGFPLQTPLFYRKGGKGVAYIVKAFGRERDGDNEVMYYWVVGLTGIRFKAFANELEL